MLVRHAKRAGFPGLTMCGLNAYLDKGVKFGKSRQHCNCPACDAAIRRVLAKPAKPNKDKMQETKLREYMGKLPWKDKR